MLTVINPRAYDFVDPDDMSLATLLPIDEWRCSCCETPIGWVVYEGERIIVHWRDIWIQDGADLFGESTERICETCRWERAGEPRS